eukprot:3398026-Pyramimonas_sp.AAC.2
MGKNVASLETPQELIGTTCDLAGETTEPTELTSSHLRAEDPQEHTHTMNPKLLPWSVKLRGVVIISAVFLCPVLVGKVTPIFCLYHGLSVADCAANMGEYPLVLLLSPQYL